MGDPTDVANLSLWLRADALSLADGAAVATWTDSSGNGFNATAAGTAQPTFKTNILNGKPVIRFDGATDKMPSSAPSSGALQTLFAVVRPTGLTGDDPIRAGSGSSGLIWRLRAGKSCVGNQDVAVIGTATTSVSTSAFRILAMAASDTANTWAAYNNGAADGSGTTTYALTAGRTTIIGGEPTAEFFGGDIAEVIVYTRILTAGERATVHSYLQDKYGITVADYVPSNVTVDAAAAMAAKATTGVGAVVGKSGAAALSADASLGAAANVDKPAAASLVATASAAVASTREAPAAGDLTATASLAAHARQTQQAAAAMVATASLAGAAQTTQQTGASLAATATVGAAVTADRPLAAGLAAHASVAADATRAVTPAGQLVATASLAASVGDTATITAKATLLGEAGLARPAIAILAAQASVGADPTRTQPSASVLVAVATLGAGATREQPGAAVLAAAAALSAAARQTHQSAAQLAAKATVAADARLLHLVASVAAAKATLTAGAVRIRPTAADLTAVAQLGTAAGQTNEVAAVLAAAARVLGDGVQSQPLAAALSAAATMGVAVVRIRLPVAELVAHATLGGVIRIRYVDSVDEMPARPPVPPHPTRVIAQNILSGRWLSWDLPVHDLTVTHNLSGPDVITGAFPTEVHDLRDVDLEPWGTWVYVEEDGVIRASGILQPSGVDENEALTLEAVGVSGYAHGIPYMGEFALSGTDPASGTTGVGIHLDPADIVRAIWAHLQSYPDATLGVQVTGSTAVRIGTPPENVDYTTGNGDQVQYVAGPYSALDWWQATDCGDEITKLARETPFDFVERAVWNANRTAVQQFVDLGYPRIGRRRFDLRFAQDENLLAAIGPEETDNLYASQVVLLGKGEGRDKVRGYAGQRLGSRLRRVAVIDDKTVDSTSRANALAAVDLGRRQALQDITEMTARAHHVNAPLGSFVAGDEVLVEATVPWIGDVRLWQRIQSYTWSPESDAMRLSLRRSDSFSFQGG